MSQINLPSDNQFTDPNGRMLPQWRPVLQAAARLSKLNQSQLDKLIALLQDDSGFLGAGGSGGVGDILYRGDSGWLTLAAGEEESLLTIVDHIPAWSIREEASNAEWVLMDDQTARVGDISIQFDGLNKFDQVRFEFSNIIPDNAGFAGVSAALDARLSADGVNFPATNYLAANGDGTTVAVTGIHIAPGLIGANPPSAGGAGSLTVMNLRSGFYPLAISHFVALNAGAIKALEKFHAYTGSTDVVSVKFTIPSWNFGGGRIRMFTRV